ncbi:conserved hypothetical protein [Bradyrhizobium sp. ORS 278]|uniref:type II toxin-antitoxin system RelE/ParE family toxin n=1 Tax=Bradyrhizobium sp. (strain ORS 278) TaxID=114615 RepID=UPI00015082F9|nr:conserved hypothetical protein [Bradyrhizobium sp. ORS 278]
MPRVLFTDAARGDLEDAFACYEAHAPEVVPRFRESLRAAVARLGQNPKQFPGLLAQGAPGAGSAFSVSVDLQRTPAAVYVVAVFHTSRDPTVWRNRTS